MGSHGNDATGWLTHNNPSIRHIIDFISTPEMRGFSSLKDPEKQVKFISRLFQKSGESMKITSCDEKDNEKSAEYRKKANGLYTSRDAEKNVTDIAEIYTKSVAYAKPESEELALAYANRSAVLFTMQLYDECLLDIQRSLENGYPDSMKAKLYARRAKCLMSLSDTPNAEIKEAISETKKWFLKMDDNASGRGAIEKIFTSKYVPCTPLVQEKKIDKIKFEIPSDNPEIPGASSAIEICYSEQYGRHLVAARDIRPGEIILVRKMYCTILQKDGWYRYCENCLDETVSGIPCDFCPNVIYCSEECRSKSWSDHHDIECQVISVLMALGFKPIDMVAMRITTKAFKEAGSLSELQKLVKKLDATRSSRTKGFSGDVCDSTKYAAVCTAARSSEKFENAGVFCNALEATLAAYVLATRSQMFGKKLRDSFHVFDENMHVAFIGGLLVRHVEIAKATMMTLELPDKVRRVHGLAPLQALFNHNCEPNVSPLFKTATTVYTLRPVKKGEMLCDCYYRLCYNMYPKEERQAKLQAQWHFTCSCTACEENWPMFDKLPRLNEVVATQLDKEKEKLLCDAIKQYIKIVDGKNVQKDLQAEDYFELRELLIDIVELICNYVFLPNKDRIHFQDLLRSCYKSIVQRF